MIQTADARFVHSFFADRLGLHWSEDFRGVLWVPDEYNGCPMDMEHVAVAVAYNAFIGRTCCMHSVIQRPDLVNRRMVRDTFAYPFLHANCEAVLALVDASNEAAMRFDTKLGFREIARVPHGGVDGDLCVLQMLRNECRWIRAH